MRLSGVLRLLALTLALVATWIFARNYVSGGMKTIRLPRWLAGSAPKETEAVKTKCDLSKPCPANFFAFKICSGAANVVGPSLCFENHMIMSPVKNNVGRGLNIALVNGTTGTVMRQKTFDMYSGDVQFLVKFLKEIPEGTLVLVASYDDPGTKMNSEVRQLFSSLGSSYADQLGFRDSWVFLGAKDLRSKSPFEQMRNRDLESSHQPAQGPEPLRDAPAFPRQLSHTGGLPPAALPSSSPEEPPSQASGLWKGGAAAGAGLGEADGHTRDSGWAGRRVCRCVENLGLVCVYEFLRECVRFSRIREVGVACGREGGACSCPPGAAGRRPGLRQRSGGWGALGEHWVPSCTGRRCWAALKHRHQTQQPARQLQEVRKHRRLSPTFPCLCPAHQDPTPRTVTKPTCPLSPHSGSWVLEKQYLDEVLLSFLSVSCNYPNTRFCHIRFFLS
nr:protein FAM3D isoform X2 [Microcebus murinus]